MKANSFLALIVGILIGVVSLYFANQLFFNSKTSTNSKILLENIKKVCKLSTV